jgi:hypothetical protein
MSESNLKRLFAIYLSMDNQQMQEVSRAEKEIIATGAKFVSPFVITLRDRLRQHRSLTKSRAELSIELDELERKFGQAMPWNDALREYVLGSENSNLSEPQAGMSDLQEIMSKYEIDQATKLINRLGEPGYQPLCTFLNNTDYSLALTAAIVIHEIDEVPPLVLKSIAASRYMHLELSLGVEVRIIYYLLLAVLARCGDIQMQEGFAAEGKSYGLESEEFDEQTLGSAIYIISISH